METRSTRVAARAAHGHRTGGFSPTYNSWRAMIQRCHNPKHPRYEDYGGRGITVCDRWRGEGGFANFLEDVGERPAGLTLDRIDADRNYEPGNVRWATKIEQRWNRRDMVHRSLPWQTEDLEPTTVSEPTPSGEEQWPF